MLIFMSIDSAYVYLSTGTCLRKRKRAVASGASCYWIETGSGKELLQAGRAAAGFKTGNVFCPETGCPTGLL